MSQYAKLAEELVDGVLLPLAEGGEVRPIKPVGAKLALAATAQPLLVNTEAARRLERLRLSAARRLLPLDDLPPITEEEWCLGFALSDLLQVAHPDLPGVFGRSRPAKLLEYVQQVLHRVGAPDSLGEAVARHATFGRVPELVRTDTLVQWWTGKRQFVGQPPSGNLLAWPKLRRVRVSKSDTRLGELLPAPGGHGSEWSERWLEMLLKWLDATPLTRLARAAELNFEWSGSTVALASKPEGRRLAWRAIDTDGDPKAVFETLEAQAANLPNEQQQLVAALIQELSGRVALEARR